MQNMLIYFYNLHIDSLLKIKEEYFFTYQNRNFLVTPYNRDLNEARAIYELNKEMLKDGYPVYEIVLTKTNNLLFLYKDIYYILMIFPLVNNKIITYEDIISFNYIPQNINSLKILDKSNWSYLWEKKIDYLEKRMTELNQKYPLIQESFNFYIGIWENAISYYNDNFINYKLKQVVHQRVLVETDFFL